MELLRSFISLFNRSGERSTRLNSVNLSIPVCYYGHTYVAQPNSDELKRAAFILESRNKNVTKHFSQLLSCYDEGTIILRDNSRQAILKLEIRKVVVCGVDPKHQRLLAIVYDNDSSESSMGMECHIFLCRTKMAAKMSANKIGDKLNKLQIKSSERLPPRVKLDEVNILTRPSVSEFDYENINKFFREEVFNLSVQEPSSESSSTYLTTGCDSGRASTVASVDMRSEEASRDFINPIEEGEESEAEIDLDISHKVNPRVQQLLSESHVTNHENNKLNKQIRKHKDIVGSSSDVIKCSPLIRDDNAGKDNQIQIVGSSSQIVGSSSDTIKCSPLIKDSSSNKVKESVMNGRFSGQYELTRTRAKTIGDASSRCNGSINDTFSTDRYSHQCELTCVPGKIGPMEDRYGRDRDYITGKGVVSNNKCENSRKSKTELKENNIKHKEDNRILSEKLTTRSDGQCIKNRYSVPYDEQDELDDDDNVFETHGEGKEDGTLISEMLSNSGITLRKIDKRDLHRLTYLSATNI